MAYDKLVDSAQLDSDLGDIADAIRAKSGGSSSLAFPAGFVSEIGTISGGGGSGYAKMTGSFVLATDYTYSNGVNYGYTGSLLVDTGLQKIDYVTIWVEEWINQTLGEATSAGLYIAANRLARIGDNMGTSAYYIPAVGVLKNNATNYFYGDTYGGIVTNLVCPNDVPEGSFGFRCRASAYPLRAGHTIKWEAFGEE